MNIVKNNPIESVATILGFIIVASGLAISREAGWIGIIGNILAILGSVLSTVVGAWVFGKSSASQGLINQLNILRGQLATASAQISHTVDTGISGDEEPRICLTKIEQTTNTLMMVVHDLSRLTDKNFDIEKDAILSAKKTFSELGNKLYEIENTGAGVSDKDEMIFELNKKVHQALTSLDRAVPTPRSKYISKNKSVELPKLGPKDLLLAKIRKLGMQFTDPNTQELIIKKIHGYLLKNKSLIAINELKSKIIDEELRGLLDSKFTTRSKFNQIFNIFLRAGAFEKTEIKSAESYPQYSIKLKEKFEDFGRFRELHDAVFYCVGKGINISPQEINNILYESITYDPSVSDDMISYVNSNLHFEEGCFDTQLINDIDVKNYYTGDPRIKSIMNSLREIAGSDTNVFSKISNVLTAFEQNNELRKELKGIGIPLSTVREAITVVIPDFQQDKHGFIKFSDLIKHVGKDTSIIVKSVADKGFCIFLDEQ